MFIQSSEFLNHRPVIRQSFEKMIKQKYQTTDSCLHFFRKTKGNEWRKIVNKWYQRDTIVMLAFLWNSSHEAKHSAITIAVISIFYESKNHSRHVFVFRMLIPKKNRIAIYEYLFKEGVMVAKKDDNAPKHLSIEGVPNLQVVKAAQVCNSNPRGYLHLIECNLYNVQVRCFISNVTSLSCS